MYLLHNIAVHLGQKFTFKVITHVNCDILILLTTVPIFLTFLNIISYINLASYVMVSFCIKMLK